ncbi:MAG: hypothetical protein RHS_3342 [Robinsoniella sp. RHS]|nr:MAG: hypothetical protein RHS_3342 [Robinsoniella sp. RHS]
MYNTSYDKHNNRSREFDFTKGEIENGTENWNEEDLQQEIFMAAENWIWNL